MDSVSSNRNQYNESQKQNIYKKFSSKCLIFHYSSILCLNIYLYLLLLSLFNSGLAFNIAPKATYIASIKFPNNDNGYFGYSVGLLKTRNSKFWLLAGAPLANSSASGAIYRPGAFYKCPIDKPDVGCKEVILDKSRNFDRVQSDRHPFRNNAWTGSSIDVDEDGNVIVCAPRWKNARYQTEYRISGACYLLGQDLGDNTALFIGTLLDSDYQIYSHYDRGVYYYAHGQAGMSVHFANNTELLIGSPGVLNWQGSVAKYIRQQKVPIGGINKRETSFIYSKKIIPNPIRTSKIQDSDFFGYSVTSGKFDAKSETYYVAGAPRGASLHGLVLVFMMRNYEMQPLHIKESKTGTQVGEYFGASVAAPDLNGDGLSDLVVGAPLYSVEGLYDVGCVYVFINIKREERPELSTEAVKLMGDISQLARFGTSLGTPGDLDNDGYQDLLVGAPYEKDNAGAVYVFMGSKNGIRELYQQKLLPEEASPAGSLKGFGISFSRPMDVDGNSYPDFAVGSFLSDEAVLMSTRPVIVVRGEMSSNPSKLSLEKDFFTLQTCLMYEGKQFIDRIDFLASIYISQESERGEIVADFSDFGSTEIKAEFSSVSLNEKMCKEFRVNLKLEKSNAQKPIVVRMDFELKNKHLKDTANPVMSPHISFPPELVLSFVTGCENDDLCRSDLVSTATIKNFRLGSSLLIGDLSKIILEVFTLNKKEPAFLPSITISIPNPIIVLPSVRDCSNNQDVDKTVVVCQLKNPLLQNETDSIFLELDLTHLDDSSSDINILVRSDSAADVEEEPDDNFFPFNIKVEKSASVEVTGYSRPEQYTYERLSEYDIILKENETVHVEHKFTITKSGVTPVRNVDVVVQLPYKFDFPDETIQTLQDIQYQLHHSPSSNCELDNSTKKENKTFENNLHDSTFEEYPTRENYMLKSLSCDSEYAECAIIKCKVGPWKKSQTFATLAVSFNIDLTVLSSAISLKDGFSLLSIVEVSIVSHKGTTSVKGKRFDNGTVQTIFYPGSLPAEPLSWWIYLSAAIGGIIVLLIIAFILYKIGFFKRKAKEELKAQQAHLLSKGEKN